MRTLTDRGDKVFLDLKFHDIPNTVAAAVAAATRLGVWMVNVHAGGGTAMMRAAREARRSERRRETRRRGPLVIAVTVLTSMNRQALNDAASPSTSMDHVLRLAELTQGRRAGRRRRIAKGDAGDPWIDAAAFAIVTPGIRGGSRQDRAKERSGTDDDAARGDRGWRLLSGGRPSDYRGRGPAGGCLAIASSRGVKCQCAGAHAR